MVVVQEAPKNPACLGEAVVIARREQLNAALNIAQGGKLREGVNPTALREAVYKTQRELVTSVAEEG